MIQIRRFLTRDWTMLWSIIEPVFRAGETYAFSPGITEEDAYHIWIEKPKATFVAFHEDRLVGTYFIRENQPGLGAHVCNCGYIVGEKDRGKGVASRMCEHSQDKAVEFGFAAMQYNLVVSTNESAIRIWKSHGFEIVGTLPKAFKHSKLGLTDALVMYKLLI